MTSLVFLPREKARDVLIQALGADAAQTAGLADLVREEVTARGSCARAMTIKRVCRFVAPAIALDSSTVSDVCDLLEREGDVVVATAGLLYCTPLRAIDLGDGTLKIVSSLPTRRLTDILVGTWNVAGTSRTCAVQHLEGARGAVNAVGGVVLAPSEWACFDRVPLADQHWLDGLDRRLKTDPESPASLERDERLAWAGCVATPTSFRWNVTDADPSTRLWRAKNQWGRWQYAWTEFGTPRTSQFVALRPDDGARTAFAVARAHGVSPELTIDNQEQNALLSIPYWLPIAEYRFLAATTTSLVQERHTIQCSMPIGRMSLVLDVLQKRLGLTARLPQSPPSPATSAGTPAGDGDELAQSLLSVRAQSIVDRHRLDTVETLRDWLSTPESHHARNFGRKTRQELEEVVKQAGIPLFPTTVREGPRAPLRDVVDRYGSVQIERLGRFSGRASAVLSRTGVRTVSQLVDWLEGGDSSREQNFGRTSREELVARLFQLLNVGPERLLFGQDAIPSNGAELCTAYVGTLKSEEVKYVFRRYYFERVTLEKIGQARGVTRERIRQIIQVTLSADRAAWSDVANSVLHSTLQLLESGAGLAPLGTCLELAGCSSIGELELAVDLAGVRMSFPADGKLQVATLLTSEDLANLRADIRQELEEAIAAGARYNRIAAILQTWGLRLPDLAAKTLLQSFWGIEASGDSVHSSRRRVQSLYVEALRAAGRPLTAEEVAERLAQTDPDMNATKRNAATNLRRSELVFKADHGTWIHVDNIGISRERLRKAAEDCLPFIPRNGVAVSTRHLTQALQNSTPIPGLTPYLLRDALIGTGKVRGWRAGCDVAWRASAVSRSSVDEWIEVVAQSLDQPFQLSELTAAVAKHGGFMSTTVAMKAAENPTLLHLGCGDYVSRSALFDSDEAFARTRDALIDAIPTDDVSTGRAAAAVRGGRGTLLSEDEDARVSWAIARTAKEVSSRIRGHLLWRTSHAKTAWSAFRTSRSYSLPGAFRVREFAVWLKESYGVTEESVAYVLVQEGHDEGSTLSCGQGWYIDLLAGSEEVERAIDTTPELERLVRCSQDFVRKSPARHFLNQSRCRRGLFEV